MTADSSHRKSSDRRKEKSARARGRPRRALPEFREFFVRQFSLGTNVLSRPGYVRAPSGMIYALVFVGRSGEPFPDGIEIYALPDALEPLDDPEVDADLWALLRWMIAGVGNEWRVEELDATGRLYQLSVAASA